jgi:hypothetical protein
MKIKKWIPVTLVFFGSSVAIAADDNRGPGNTGKAQQTDPRYTEPESFGRVTRKT